MKSSPFNSSRQTVTTRERLQDALRSLETALRLHHDKAGEDRELELALQDSVVQRFEYTYELAWNAMRRWIAENDHPQAAEPVYSRKELFRRAARLGLIPDPIPWMEFHAARNVSAHPYEKSNARRAFQAARELVKEGRVLLERLEAGDG
ncbi:MAG: nucleotidyltransferase substrate binding protein [Magnetococcales bacterium]|nr:nucleotidyltransferase substrate binding protein [Magnetococcales bacterium]